MTLYSLTFIICFLPISAALYRTVPLRLRTAVMAALSLAFYILAAGRYFFLLPLLTLLVYLLSFLGKKAAFLCLLALIPLRLLSVSEIGVSFFILRSSAYIYDGHRERNFFKVFAFLTFFPCVHAGPLVGYGTFEQGFSKSLSHAETSQGICMYLYGAFKKLFFADALYALFLPMHSGMTSLSSLIALFAYALYIYFDFSGCSDIAIGISKMFGFSLLKNFDFPYMSRTVSEFFRRWHMTLGNWLCRYVYIPLGGSRNGKMRTFLSLLSVWLFSALWHGSNLSYLVWGLYFFLICAVEKLVLPKSFKFGRLCTFCLVCIGWVFFFSDTPAAALRFFGRLFCLGDTLLYSRADIYNAMHNIPLLLLAAVFASPLPRKLLNALYSRARAVLYIASFPLVLLILSCIMSSGHIPFLYATF